MSTQERVIGIELGSDGRYFTEKVKVVEERSGSVRCAHDLEQVCTPACAACRATQHEDDPNKLLISCYLGGGFDIGVMPKPKDQ